MQLQILLLPFCSTSCILMLTMYQIHLCLSLSVFVAIYCPDCQLFSCNNYGAYLLMTLIHILK